MNPNYGQGLKLHVIVIAGFKQYRSKCHFETAFMEKFGDKKTLNTLMIELSQIKMENKEGIKY